jgi:hypothetical protein
VVFGKEVSRNNESLSSYEVFDAHQVYGAPMYWGIGNDQEARNMRRRALLIAITLALSGCSSGLWAYTLTFDDIPTGQDVSYYQQQYGLAMVPGWEVIDSVASGWETPRSGTQAVVWSGQSIYATGFDFGFEDGVSEYTVRSVGAYFTTQPGVVLAMRGYTSSGLVTANIGSSTGSWTNHYVQISSAAADIRYVHIVGLSSPDARYHFSMDDLTVVPVPEPSSIIALGFALSAMGAMLRRRR